jgi:hypothetical protein
MSVTLTREEIKDFIVNNKEKNVNEIANLLNVPMPTIRANRAWLVQRNIVEPIVPKKNKTQEEKINETIKKVDSIFAKIKKTSKNTYTNQDGVKKSDARERMVQPIVDSGVFGVIASLPNEEWIIEQMIDSKVKGNSFIGVERDFATFKIMKSKFKQLKKSGFLGLAVHGQISSLIYGKNENSFAHLILDYCGNLVTIKKEIEYAIQNNILSLNGIMAITFSKPIRGIDSESLKLLELAPINNSDARCDSDRAIEAYFNKVTGFTHKIVEIFYYRDTYPMTLVIIKRIK